MRVASGLLCVTKNKYPTGDILTPERVQLTLEIMSHFMEKLAAWTFFFFTTSPQRQCVEAGIGNGIPGSMVR